MKKGVKIVMFSVLAIAGLSLMIYLTMVLWNWLVPELFHGPVLSFWQTLGLFVLSKIFFGTFFKGRNGGSHWKPYWKQKWNSMSPEDRERFKQKMKDKWCYKPETSSGDSTSDSTNATV
jgi:hypothetical protein